ncbi:MAG: LamG-like jellyroll fold domain-containing protein [Bacteroidota bacterium]
MRKFTLTIFGLFSLLTLTQLAHAQVTDSEMYFDGTDDFLAYSGFPALNETYTFECYLRIDSLHTEATIWNFDDGNFSPWLGYEPYGSIAFYDLDDYYAETDSFVIASDSTYHIAYVWDGTEGRIYVDGVNMASHTTRITVPMGSFRIGDTEAEGGFPFLGHMDEFRVSDTVRYVGDTVSIAPVPWPFDSNTVLLYHFDECAGQTVGEGNGSLVMSLGADTTAAGEVYDPSWSCGAASIDNVFASQISVYPNPMQDKFTIDLGDTYSNVRIELTDISGRKIYAQSHSHTQRIDVHSQTQAGFYYLTISSDDNQATFKLIKH